MKRKVSGVTLIEIMVAMVVLAVGLYMIYNIFPMAFASSYRSKNRLIASQLAQQKLELVIQNRESADCYHHRTGEKCRVAPLESDYSVDPDYHTTDGESDFDCRYYYGGSLVDGKVSSGCRCRFHSGSREVAGNWNRCSSDPADSGYDFWYHIDITPVTDVCRKYRSLGDLVQATVRVRGPIDSADIATESNWQSRPRGMRMAVEAVLTTMVANNIMGNTTIDQGYNTGKYRNGILNDTSDDYHGRKIRVKNIRNFTMFLKNGLSAQELEDRPKVSYFELMDVLDEPKKRAINFIEMAGNYYKLDNIAITRHLYMEDSDAKWIEWQKCLGGTGTEGSSSDSILQLSDGSYMVMGITNSTNGDVSGNHGGYDVWLVKLTSDGVIDTTFGSNGQICFGGTGTDYGYNMIQTFDNGYLLVGYTNSTNGDVSGNHGGGISGY